MKTKHQLLIVKTAYISTLACALLLSLDDTARGFEDGYHAACTSSWSDIIEGILSLFICFFTLRVLVYLYRFFDSVQQGAVFNEENSQRLSRMDGYCTAIPFLLFGFNTINYLREVSSPGIQVSNIIKHVDFEIWLLIFGLTLLTIAFVFKKGIALTQENELTT